MTLSNVTDIHHQRFVPVDMPGLKSSSFAPGQRQSRVLWVRMLTLLGRRDTVAWQLSWTDSLVCGHAASAAAVLCAHAVASS
jgi:hypothetical protein